MEEEKKLIERSKSCDSCFKWHDICGAECCKGFFVQVPDTSTLYKGQTLITQKIISPDLQLYYKLHNQSYGHGTLRIILDDFKIISKTKIFVHARCKNLTEDLKCKEYRSGKRPKLCDMPNFQKYKELSGVELTPNCVFTYKLKSEEENGMVQNINR